MPPEAPKAAARALNLSLKALAAEVGVHWTTLYRYQRGEAAIPLTVALAIECLLRRKGLFAE